MLTTFLFTSWVIISVILLAFNYSAHKRQSK